MRALLGSLAAAVLLSVGLAAPASADPAADPAAFPLPLPTAPEGDYPGVNDWTCAPTAERPTPVVLVHGTFGDRRHLLEPLSQSMLDAGFCVFSLDYGNRGTDEIVRSARVLDAFVDRVLAETGAAKVSLVGHSQGGMMPRYFIKNLGGAAVVDDLVGLVPSNHGTVLTGPDNPLTQGVFGIACPACVQQTAGSPFLADLNAGDETPGDVSYTQITTRFDEVVVPYLSAYLTEGPNTTNLTIQDTCPLVLADHLLLPTVPAVIELTLDALTHAGPADPAYQPTC